MTVFSPVQFLYRQTTNSAYVLNYIGGNNNINKTWLSTEKLCCYKSSDYSSLRMRTLYIVFIPCPDCKIRRQVGSCLLNKKKYQESTIKNFKLV